MIIGPLKNSRKLVVKNLINLTDNLDIKTMKIVTRTRVIRAMSIMSQQMNRIFTRRKLSVMQTL